MVVPGLVHVVGNAALDILVRDVEIAGVAAEDVWGANVDTLARPVEAALGGCGAAPAYVLGRLGTSVVLNANIGGDTWGQMLTHWLQDVGVELMAPMDAATATHVIALAPDGRRRSFYYTGANVNWERSLAETTPEWLLVSGYGKVGADDLEAMRRLCGQMRCRGARVLFDPSPWFAGRVAVDAMQALWKEVDCLSATQDELAAWEEGADCQALASAVLARGVAQVAIKRGGQGAYYAERGGARGHVAVERVENANTVGAGDSFNGRLVHGLCQGEALAPAVAAAAGAAAGVVRGGRGVLGLVS